MQNRGLTLIEILITVAVVGLIVLVVTPQFSKIKERQVLKDGVETIISSVDKAQSKTLASVDSSSYGVHFETNQVVIFKGTSYSAGAPTNEIINITAPAYISSSAWDVYFKRLTGAPSATGAITLTTPNYSKIITISATGTASVN